jgi:hypothetical protein
MNWWDARRRVPKIKGHDGACPSKARDSIPHDNESLFSQAPGEQHVFLAQFTGVVDEREAERIAVALEIINPLAIATFRLHATNSDQRYRVSIDCIFAPCVTLPVLRQIDVESTVSLDHPNSTDRIRPIADQRSRARFVEPGAALQQRQNNSSGDKLIPTLCVHAGHAAWRNPVRQVQNAD